MFRHDDITRQETRNFHEKHDVLRLGRSGLPLCIVRLMFQVTIPDSRIYLDVNPSIEIVTNRQNKVIDLIADNLDGRRITRILIIRKNFIRGD